MRESLRHGLWLRACKGAEHRSAFTHPANDLKDDRLPDMHTPNTAPEPCAHPRRRAPRLAAGPRSTSTATTKVPSSSTHPANRLKDERPLTCTHQRPRLSHAHIHDAGNRACPLGPGTPNPKVCVCVCAFVRARCSHGESTVMDLDLPFSDGIGHCVSATASCSAVCVCLRGTTSSEAGALLEYRFCPLLSAEIFRDAAGLAPPGQKF